MAVKDQEYGDGIDKPMKTNGKEKRVRKPRRNFEKELAGLKLYCEVSVETLRDAADFGIGLEADDATENRIDDRVAGKIAAFERVLAKINNGGAA